MYISIVVLASLSITHKYMLSDMEKILTKYSALVILILYLLTGSNRLCQILEYIPDEMLGP